MSHINDTLKRINELAAKKKSGKRALENLAKEADQNIKEHKDIH
ncbi:MAG: hypothetical protein E6188_04810 [Veillonella sp.]|nr:hypothetical protein [Veillonella sp.]